uniref:Uncharacterized protein n=1 Tax=Glossina brevipalpis TaxID=37001 RepID=A0A1A9W5L6_9MUSC
MNKHLCIDKTDKAYNTYRDVTEIEDLNEVTKLLRNSLNKLADGEGPKYRLDKLHSAMEGRGVYGKAYYIDADLIDESGKTKICSLSTWSTYDSNEIKITFRCDGEQKLVRKHSL